MQIRGLFFVDGDMLSLMYFHNLVNGWKCSAIAFESGEFCEIYINPVNGEIYVSLNSTIHLPLFGSSEELYGYIERNMIPNICSVYRKDTNSFEIYDPKFQEHYVVLVEDNKIIDVRFIKESK